MNEHLCCLHTTWPHLSLHTWRCSSPYHQQIQISMHLWIWVPDSTVLLLMLQPTEGAAVPRVSETWFSAHDKSQREWQLGNNARRYCSESIFVEVQESQGEERIKGSVFNLSYFIAAQPKSVEFVESREHSWLDDGDEILPELKSGALGQVAEHPNRNRGDHVVQINLQSLSRNAMWHLCEAPVDSPEFPGCGVVLISACWVCTGGISTWHQSHQQEWHWKTDNLRTPENFFFSNKLMHYEVHELIPQNLPRRCCWVIIMEERMLFHKTANNSWFVNRIVKQFSTPPGLRDISVFR